MCCAGFLFPRGREIFASLSEGDLQARGAHLQASLCGWYLPPSLREVAFSRENDGRSLHSETCRNHQGGSFLQTSFVYVLSFLKRKYERKQFGEDPETPLKGQGGAYLPSQRHRCERQKSGSNVRLFLIVRGFCACGDGIKQEFFCLIFQNTNKKERETRSFDESIKFAQNNYRSFFHLLSFQA